MYKARNRLLSGVILYILSYFTCVKLILTITHAEMIEVNDWMFLAVIVKLYRDMLSSNIFLQSLKILNYKRTSEWSLGDSTCDRDQLKLLFTC